MDRNESGGGEEEGRRAKEKNGHWTEEEVGDGMWITLGELKGDCVILDIIVV